MRNWLVYTDGSFGGSSDPGKVHGAIVYWGENGMESAVHVVTSLPEFVNMNNVGGEIVSAWAALIAVAGIVKENNKTMMDSYEVTIVYDLQGVGMWANGKWKTNKPGTRWYREQIDQIRTECPNLKINWVWKKGHFGVEGNEMADRVASYNMGYAKSRNIPICDLDTIIKL